MSCVRRALPLLLALAGCAKLFPSKERAAQAGPPVPLAGPAPDVAAPAAQPAAGAGKLEARGPERYAVPFAWETSPNEPLARARGFLAEVLRANLGQVGLGRQHFAPFLDAQTPRATIVTCADSRVQTDAWDQTPENDDFIVRNIGNQVSTVFGSIEYGVEHLQTPLLLIVGHTGCGAVRAALGKPGELSPAIRAELATLKLPPAPAGASAEQRWTDAVIANVNAQVALATEHFAPRVHSGDLTVVGAVYDLRNELSKGYGRLHLVNVNTNTEPARIEAFLRAIGSPPAAATGSAERFGGSEHASEAEAKRLPADPVLTDARVRAMIEKATKALPGPHPVATVTTANEK